MSQDNEDKSKSSGTSGPTQPPTPSADPTKRPYATIDLKATELPGAKPVQPPASAAKPSAPAAGPGTAVPKIGAVSAIQPGQASASPKPSGPASGPAAAKSTAAIKPPAAASAWLPSLISGAAGAVLTLLGLGSMGLIGGDANTTALSTKLASLEKSIANSQPAAAVTKQLADAEARLVAIETSHAALSADAKSLDSRLSSQSPATSAAAAAVDKVQKLEQQLADLAAAASADPQRGRIPALAQITTKLGDLDTQISTRASSLKAELSQELEKRLATSAETAEQARARLAQRTQNIEQTLKSVGDDTTALRTSVEGMKSDLDSRFKATAKPADVTAAIEPVTAKVDGLAKDLAGVVRSEQDRNATAGNILLSIELGNLKRALDRGGSYAVELAAVKKASGGKLNLAVLEGAQASGIASLTALTKEFSGLAYTMLDAETEPADGTVLERMLAGAKSVVRVRKVVHSDDDKGTEATIGRMETFLKDGRLGDVLDESKKLAGKPLAVAAPWLKKIEARNTIETSLAGLEQNLKNALAGTADLKKGGN